MNTRMLLTAVMRNRRSQWTLLPKVDADADTAEGDAETAAGAHRSSGETAVAARGREPASRSG
jgi:hypothetical protein